MCTTTWCSNSNSTSFNLHTANPPDIIAASMYTSKIAPMILEMPLHTCGSDMQDDARTVAVEVREVFRQRKDKLQERRSWPLKETTWEVLAPGARGALKQATLVKGQRRDLLFYHQVMRTQSDTPSSWVLQDCCLTLVDSASCYQAMDCCSCHCHCQCPEASLTMVGRLHRQERSCPLG